jgi:hypothetical protein
MPGDTLRYSRSLPVGAGINTSVTGANQTWNFSSLTPIAQGVDTYKTALQVNPFYALTIAPNAYGYKVADSFPTPPGTPVQIRNIYAFFSKKPANNPNRFVAEGGAMTVNGAPTAANYSDEDEYFFFPLNYGDVDSSTYALNYSIASLGSLKQTGYRKTTVDGWGTIVTPFTGSSPVSVLRLRTIVRGEDTATAFGQTFPIPRRIVEYRWMALGQRYPVLFVTANNATGTEVITDVRYRDVFRQITTSVRNAPAAATFSLYPNPATDAMSLIPPRDFLSYTVEVYSAAGALIYSGLNETTIRTGGYAAGMYVVVLRSGANMAVARFQK